MTAHLKATLSNAVDLDLTDYVDEDEDGEGDVQGEVILSPLQPQDNTKGKDPDPRMYCLLKLGSRP
jgi:hypothetical protein